MVQRTSNSKPEAFIPTVADIGAESLSSNEDIQRNIEMTTEALLINPIAYQMDGCDTFISQIISPISVYNVLMVSGSLRQWTSYVLRNNLPASIEAYRKAIESVLLAEYSNMQESVIVSYEEDSSTDQSKEEETASPVGT
jgi:hypothetical protein